MTFTTSDLLKVRLSKPRKTKGLRVGHNHHPCTANSKAHHRKQLDDLARMEVIAIWAKGRMSPPFSGTKTKPAESLRLCQGRPFTQTPNSRRNDGRSSKLMNEIINSTKVCDLLCLPASSFDSIHHLSSFIIIYHHLSSCTIPT